MKILFLTLSKFSQFPTYKRAVGMGEALAVLGHSVSIAVLDCEENRLRMSAEAPHCNAMWIRATNPITEAWQKLRLVWSVQPDIIYSPSYSVRNLAFLSWLFPRRCLYCLEFCELYTDFGSSPFCDVIRERMSVFESDALVCASRYLVEYFSKRVWSKGKPSLYLPYAYPRYLKPMRQGYSGGRIVFMAALYRNYGIYDVLAACKILHDCGLDFYLDVLGGGPEKAAAIDWVDRNCLSSKVKIHGYVAEEKLNDFFSSADVFVSPLHNTVQDLARCPSKIYYYIPYGKPVVTCKLGDPYEALGEYGYYYEPEDIEDLAKTLARALKSSKGFQYPEGYIEKHSWCARAVSFINWVEEVRG